MVALEDNKTQNVLFRFKLTLRGKGDGVKLLLPSGGVCPLSLSPSTVNLSPCEQQILVTLEAAHWTQAQTPSTYLCTWPEQI